MLARYPLTSCFFYWVPAAALVALSFAAPRNPRLVLLAVAAILLTFGIGTTLRALARSRRDLHLMRDGFMTLGRVVSARFAWDRKSANKPYAELLPNWVIHMGKSQMNKGVGCLINLVVLVFLVPMGLFAISLLLAVVLGYLYEAPVDRETLTLALATAGGLMLSIGSYMFYLRMSQRVLVGMVEPYVEWRKLMAGQGNDYDADARALAEEAEELSPEEPLPRGERVVQLICQVEYSIAGKRQLGEGGAYLSDRLDLSGIERLLFHPVQPERVIFMAGLPEEVGIDPLGRWKAVSDTRAKTLLGLTVAVAGFALAGIAAQWPLIVSVYR